MQVTCENVNATRYSKITPAVHTHEQSKFKLLSNAAPEYICRDETKTMLGYVCYLCVCVRVRRVFRRSTTCVRVCEICYFS